MPPHSLNAHAVSRLAADPAKAPGLSLDGVSSLIFTLLGSIIMAVVGVRMFTAYTKKAWGELITELVAVVFIGWFVWFPGSAQTTIQGIIHGVFG